MKIVGDEPKRRCIMSILGTVLLGVTLTLSSRPAVAGDPDKIAQQAVFDCWQLDHVIKQCATAGPDGRPRLARSFLSRLHFGRDGLASVVLLGAAENQKNRWFYVRRGGAMAQVATFDNGPDPFSDGLARSPVGDKTGYIDRSLTLVIPASYDGAYPFEHGVAVVCQGCVIVSDGEHSWHEGGQWGRIDRRGRLVTPLRPWTKDQRF